MLDVSTEIIRAIAQRAREFHAQEGVVIPEQSMSPTDDWALQVLAEHAGDLTFQELIGIINDLEPDQQVCLIALMWLGRGDFAADEWDDALAQAGENWTRRTAEYLIATPLLADYLEEGLSMLGIGTED